MVADLPVRFLVRPPSQIAVVILLAGVMVALTQQEQKAPENKTAAPPIAPAARLAAARTALLRRAGSSSTIAYDVVSSTLEGWGRFQLVNTQEKADVIVEVFSLEESGESGISASAGGRTGRSASREKSITLIKLTVYDAKTHVALWTGAERPKGAMKKIDRENNEVEAAQRLVTKFHDALEPASK